MTYYSLRIYVNEIGFHARSPNPLDMVSGGYTLQAWYYSAARNECMMRCLEASKDYLDRFLSLPSRQIVNFTLPDFIRLVYSMLVLGAFASGLDAPTLDVAHVRQAANLDYYLDSLVDKTGKIIKAGNIGNCCDYMAKLNDLFTQSKVWYGQITNEPSAIGYCILGRADFSFMDIISTIIGRCVDFSGICSEGSDEQWTDLFAEWSGDLDLSSIPIDAAL
jgi:hypothetical protein